MKWKGYFIRIILLLLVMEDLFGKLVILNTLGNFYQVKDMGLVHLNGLMEGNILADGVMGKWLGVALCINKIKFYLKLRMGKMLIEGIINYYYNKIILNLLIKNNLILILLLFIYYYHIIDLKSSCSYKILKQLK